MCTCSGKTRFGQSHLISIFFRFFETFCEHAPWNKLHGSTNFIIFGPTDQKLWEKIKLGEMWVRRACARTNEQELTTCAKTCGQEEGREFWQERVLGTRVGLAGNHWSPTRGHAVWVGRRPMIAHQPWLAVWQNAIYPPTYPLFSNFMVFFWRGGGGGILRKFGDGPNILGEWLYNTPIFCTLPLYLKGEIFHSSWSLEILFFPNFLA
jgi:hypothetical protein